MQLQMLWYKLLKKIFITGLLIVATVPHDSRKRYIPLLFVVLFTKNVEHYNHLLRFLLFDPARYFGTFTIGRSLRLRYSAAVNSFRLVIGGYASLGLRVDGIVWRISALRFREIC